LENKIPWARKAAMFENTKPISKIAGSIAGTPLFPSIAGFYITQHRINKQAEGAFVDQLRKTRTFAGWPKPRTAPLRTHSRP
jgi:hypothetical protein